MKSTPFYLTILTAFSVCIASFCGQTKNPGQEQKSPTQSLPSDSASGPVDKIFPWWIAGNKRIWLDIARDWYGYDSLMAGRICDSLWVKSRTAWQLLLEVKKYGLPDSSIFFEYLDLETSGIQENRALALWINHPMVAFEADQAVCETRVGGLGRILGDCAILLLDTRNKRVLQRFETIPGASDTMGIPAPFAIGKGNTYHCSLPDDNTDYKAFGIATVLYPQDLDNDGMAAEFLFYQYEACGVHDCAVLAYDPRRDKLLLRPFYLRVSIPRDLTYYQKSDSSYFEKSNWVSAIPLDSMASNGRFQYVTYVGHGSSVLYCYDFGFDFGKGGFVGFLREKPVLE